MKAPQFTYFNEEWNRDEDYLEDGVDDYVSIPKKSNGLVED